VFDGCLCTVWNYTVVRVTPHCLLCSNLYFIHFFTLLLCKYKVIAIHQRRNTLKKTTVFATVAGTTLACVGMMFAQAPVVNIDRYRHGNLAAAQSYIVQAYQKVNQAQQANDGQLGGHAQRAKDLLVQADAELRLAANTSNAEGR
jgi:hypothetical protein